MATQTATLFFKSNREYKVGSITFDLILNESHNFTGTVTRFKVEDGSAISDHIQNEPKGGGLSGLITNFSLSEGEVSTNRAQDAFDKLEELHDNKELVDVVTILKVYEDVFISNISVNRDEETGEALFADISFTEVRIVQLEEVEITASVKLKDTKTTENKQSSKKQNKGKQTGKSGNTSTTGGGEGGSGLSFSAF